MRRMTDETPGETPRAPWNGAVRWSQPASASAVGVEGGAPEPAGRSHDVPLDLPAPRVAHFTHSLWRERPGTRVLELLEGLSPRHPLHVGVLEAEGPLRDDVARLGLEAVEFREPGRGRARGPSLRIDAVAAWLRASRADLVHVHDAASALVVVPAALRVGCRVVMERSEPLPSRDRTRRAALRWLTRHAHHVVVDAQATRRRLLGDEELPPEHVSLLRPGFDLERFDAAVRAGLQRPLPDTGSAPVVVHVAPMDDASRCEEDLLTAVGLVRRRFPGLRLFLIGDGPRRAELERRAEEWGLSETVCFLGWRPDVPAVLARATVGVRCPSTEGLSRTVLEAMAARLPLVVTDAGGNAELVAHGERGQVVPPGNPDVLAEALAWALEDAPTARRMAVQARTFVARELTVARMVAGYAALYARLAYPS